MVKKGDTLVEVLLAVGIFSMIAISVVAVMSSGTSEAQLALETTLTREEIDAQAEALRYIHNAYINDNNTDGSTLPAISLWRKIVEDKNVYSENDLDEDLLQYTPDSCSTSTYPDKAFILDTRNLSEGDSAFHSGKDDDSKIFAEAPTYPQLRFGEVNNNDLISSDVSTILTQAEGIYIIAVADKDTTSIVSESGKKYPAFYDFYIRSCWYGTDDEKPSTISTVIRLHNPDAAAIDDHRFGVTYNTNGNGGGGEGEPVSIYVSSGGILTFPDYDPKMFSWPDSYRDKVRFAGWSFNKYAKPGSSDVYQPGQTLQIEIKEDAIKSIFAIWDIDPSIQYWLDVNVYMNEIGGSTSGYGKDGFHVKVYVDGKEDPYPTDPTGGDYYKTLPLNSEVKIAFNKVNGYYISNFDTICKGMRGCSTYQTSTDYYVILRVYPEYLSTVLDSSGHNAIQIEPIWKKK